MLLKYFNLKCYVLLILASLTTDVFSQNEKINALVSDLSSAKTDTAKITLLRKLSVAYTTQDPVKKQFYANAYRILAEKNHIDSTAADGYLDIGVAYAIRGNMDSAFYYSKLGKEKARIANYPKGLARANVNIGYLNDRTERKKDAVKNYEEALKIFKKINHKKGINQSITNLSSLYFDIGEYKIAHIYSLQVLENVKQTPNDKAGLATAYFSLGNSHRKIGHQDTALNYFRKSLAIRENLDDKNGVALNTWGIGMVYVNKAQYAKAISYFNIALAKNKEIKNPYQESVVLMAMANANKHLGNFEEAEKNIRLGLLKAKEAKAKALELQALEGLASLKEKQNKFAEASKIESKKNEIYDSIRSIQVKKEILVKDLQRIHTDVKTLEKQNKTTHEELSNSKITIAIITGLATTLVLLLWILFKRNKEKKASNQLLAKQALALTKANEELTCQMEFIKFQNTELEKVNTVKNKFFSIVSHDLRAPIATLKNLFELYRSDILTEVELNSLVLKLEETITNTASFLDNLLEWSKNQLEGIVVQPITINIYDVVQFNLVLLEAQAKLKQVSITNNIENTSFGYCDLNMINVVVRNLLSNAIKFSNPNGSIVFNTVKTTENLTFSITDDGPGISDVDQENLFNITHVSHVGTAGEKGYHIGLVLCKDMIAQNGGTIKLQSKLGEGTTFYISLPFAKENITTAQHTESLTIA